MKTLAFIITYNRLDLPRNMADYLADTGDVEPVFVDNASTYKPLLDYYETTPHRVERMDKNYGCSVVWLGDFLDRWNLSGGFIVTDPDLDLSRIPKDFLHVLQCGLECYPFACKAGFGLEISDLPNTKVGLRAKDWEKSNWAYKLDDMYYRASIDTTFCLCRSRLHDFPAVRTGYPYVARHVPWYYTRDTIPEDERYYFDSIGTDYNYYSKMIKEGE